MSNKYYRIADEQEHWLDKAAKRRKIETDHAKFRKQSTLFQNIMEGALQEVEHNYWIEFDKSTTEITNTIINNTPLEAFEFDPEVVAEYFAEL